MENKTDSSFERSLLFRVVAIKIENFFIVFFI